MELVTVAAFPSIVDLSLAKACLQDHGIECYVRDEHTAQISEKYNVLIGGIKLEVKPEYAPSATKLLQQNGFIKTETGAAHSFWDDLSNIQRFLIFFIVFLIVIALAYLISPDY